MEARSKAEAEARSVRSKAEAKARSKVEAEFTSCFVSGSWATVGGVDGRGKDAVLGRSG